MLRSQRPHLAGNATTPGRLLAASRPGLAHRCGRGGSPSAGITISPRDRSSLVDRSPELSEVVVHVRPLRSLQSASGFRRPVRLSGTPGVAGPVRVLRAGPESTSSEWATVRWGLIPPWAKAGATQPRNLKWPAWTGSASQDSPDRQGTVIYSGIIQASASPSDMAGLWGVSLSASPNRQSPSRRDLWAI